MSYCSLHIIYSLVIPYTYTCTSMHQIHLMMHTFQSLYGNLCYNIGIQIVELHDSLPINVCMYLQSIITLTLSGLLTIYLFHSTGCTQNIGDVNDFCGNMNFTCL